MLTKPFHFRILLLIIFLSLNFRALPQDHTTIPGKSSFMILAGHRITNDGSVLVAQNKGLIEKKRAFLRQHPKQEHDSAEVITLHNGLEIPQARFTYQWMSLQTKEGILKGEAVAINSRQVSLAGSVDLSADRNDRTREAAPMVKEGVTEEIYYIALERSHTARGCVKRIGEYYNRYGIAAPKGIAIADKNEIWYMEAGSGHHWAAIKIPDDALWVQANGYRIGHIDPQSNNVLISPGLIDFTSKNNLWNPENELFDFAEAFGGKLQKTKDKDQFNSLRIWSALYQLDSSLRITPNQTDYPQYIRPSRKVDKPRLISVLRDRYEGTPYQIDKKSPPGSPIQPIGSSGTVYTSIIQLTHGLPASIGAVLWAGFGSPVTTPYIPFYFGIKNIPASFTLEIPAEKSAYRLFESLSDLFYQNPTERSNEFPQIWHAFQRKCIKDQVHFDQGAMRLYRMNAPMARQFLTINVEELCQEALDIAQERLNSESLPTLNQQ